MLRIRIALLFCVLALASSTVAQYQSGAPWPRFQADNLSSGRGVGHGALGDLLFETQYPDGTTGFTASAVIDSNGILYAADNSESQNSGNPAGAVYAIDPGAGEPLWSYHPGDHFFCTPTLGADGTLYVAGMSGKVYALTSGDSGGSLLWSRSTGDEFKSSVSIGPDGTLYVASVKGTIYAISGGPTGGAVLWTFSNTVAEQFLCTPSIGSDGTLYVASNNQDVLALSGGPSGGAILWTCPIGQNVTDSPSIGSDGTLYVEDNGGGVHAISGGPSGGSLLWTCSTGDSFSGCPAIGSDGNLYVAGNKGVVYAISGGVLGGSQLWSYGTGDLFFGSGALASDGTVYVEGAKGSIYAISGGSLGGSLLWKVPGLNLDSYRGSPAIDSNGTVYVLGLNGTVAALGANEQISGLSVSPSTVIGGIGSIGTVNLYEPAPAGGWGVTLTSSSPYVTLPANITIQQGSTSATFAISTTQPPAAFTATISATDSAITKTASLQVYANYVTGLTLNPTTVGGGGTSTGTVSIYEPALTGGYVISLSSEYPNSVGVPASVTIPTGSTTASFAISTKTFSNVFNCDIYASDGTSGTQATLTVVGDSISSFTISPTTIGGALTARGTITLATPAPSAGWVVNVSDEYPASVYVPTTVTIPAGTSTASFAMTPLREFSNTFVCDVCVSDGHSAKQASLKIVGDSLASLSFSPSSVVGGSSSTGTVTINSPAPTGGWLVFLSTEYPSTDQVPAVVFVPPGQLSTTFTITTKATGTTYGCGVYATDGASGKQATLTITPS